MWAECRTVNVKLTVNVVTTGLFRANKDLDGGALLLLEDGRVGTTR